MALPKGCGTHTCTSSVRGACPLTPLPVGSAAPLFVCLFTIYLPARLMGIKWHLLQVEGEDALAVSRAPSFGLRGLARCGWGDGAGLEGGAALLRVCPTGAAETAVSVRMMGGVER